MGKRDRRKAKRRAKKKEQDEEKERGGVSEVGAASQFEAPQLFELTHEEENLDALSDRANLFFEASNLPVRIILDGIVGRRLIASRPVEPGELLVKETPLASVVLATHRSTTCSHCLKACGPEQQQKPWLAPASVFCSSTCEEQAQPLAALEKEFYSKRSPQSISEKAGVPVDSVCIAARILTQRKLSAEPGALRRQPEGAFHGKFEDIALLAGAKVIPSRGEKDGFEVCAEMLLADSSLLPAAVRQSVSVGHVVAALQAVNANAHGLCPSTPAGTAQIAGELASVALFPLASCINHSCYPNATFVNHGRLLNVRAIRRLAQGEEVFVNYVDIAQGKTNRREELLKTKSFHCSCLRCRNAPLPIGWPSSLPVADSKEGKSEQGGGEDGECQTVLAHDIFLDAVVCRAIDGGQHGCSGALIELGEGSGTTNELGVSLRFGCSTCKRPPIAASAVASVVAQASKVVHSAEEVYTTASDVRRALKALQGAILRLNTWLHPHHSLRFSLYLPLLNCLGAAGDFKGKLQEAEKALIHANAVYPPNMVPLIPYVQNVSSAAVGVLRGEIQVAKRKGYAQQALENAQRAASIAVVCSGPPEISALSNRLLASLKTLKQQLIGAKLIPASK